MFVYGQINIEITMFLLTDIVLALATENKYQSVPNTHKQTTIYVHLGIQNPLVHWGGSSNPYI